MVLQASVSKVPRMVKEGWKPPRTRAEALQVRVTVLPAAGLFQTFLGELFLRLKETIPADFSVVLFRPHFMLASEEYPMKVHKKSMGFDHALSSRTPCWSHTPRTNHGT